MTALSHRFDFVFLFDVTNGNPNGDPDAGNLPRLDPETNQGLVTDVCLKRKIRNYAELAKGGETGYAIYVREGAILNETASQSLSDATARRQESGHGQETQPAKRRRNEPAASIHVRQFL